MSGKIKGRFELIARETSRGIPPGSYRVKVNKISVESDWNMEHDEGTRPREVERAALPKKYGSFETSELTADVSADQDNQFQFDLSD